MPTALDGYDRQPFSADGRTHDVYRRGTGPAVIVIAEVPGITPDVVTFAERVRALGASVVLPHLFGEPGKPPSTAYKLQTLTSLCISREFNCLALGTIGPVSGWLRALARAEHERCGGPGVGVVGMCFTGNYALAMAVDDIVVAPVLSQPSLPFPIGARRTADPAVTDEDLGRIAAPTVIGLRFTADPACRQPRFDHLRRVLGDRFVAVEIDSSPGNPHGNPKGAHSVLTEHLIDEPGSPTRQALDQVLALFRDRLDLSA